MFFPFSVGWPKLLSALELSGLQYMYSITRSDTTLQKTPPFVRAKAVGNPVVYGIALFVSEQSS